MTHVATRTARIPKLSRFGWLMGLYAENFNRLTRLFEPADLAPGAYVSCIGDGLDLRLDVIQQHAYTTELRMTYLLRDPLTGEPDPSAFLRLYRDARQVEATHCYVGRRWQDVIGMYPPPAEVLGPSHAHEHVPRQVAAIPRRRWARRRHAGCDRVRTTDRARPGLVGGALGVTRHLPCVTVGGNRPSRAPEAVIERPVFTFPEQVGRSPGLASARICPSCRRNHMTKLDKPLRREVEIGDKAYTLTIDPTGLKLVEKGHRKGLELSWKDLVSGDAAIASALNAAN